MKKKERAIYFLVFLIFVLGLIIRLYRLGELLGFHFDQGRDAQIIMEMIRRKRPVLIGPPIGIDGPFRGPFFYWLLAPFYALSGGDPIFPVIFLAVLNAFGIVLIFWLGAKLFGKTTGILASLFYAFSADIVFNCRWLANPNPASVLSLLFFFSLYQFLVGDSLFLPIVLFLASFSLHFETAGAVFFFPIIFLAWLWKKPKINRKMILLSLAALALPFLPFVVFDLRHDFLISKSYWRFAVSDQAQIGFLEIVRQHLLIYLDAFGGVLLPDFPPARIVTLALGICLGISFWLWRKNFAFRFLVFALFIPLAGFLFYRGNRGHLWGYYFLNYFPIFLLAVAFFLQNFWQKNWGKLLIGLFLVIFFLTNLATLSSHFSLNLDRAKGDGGTVVLANQKRTIDWVYQDSQAEDFNVDVYVPPVIPYAYDYLFKWYGFGKYGREPLAENASLLYTLSEADPGHPERINAWLDRQAGIGKILTGETFGDIAVQRRERIKSE